MIFQRRTVQPEGIFTRALLGFFEANRGVIVILVLFIRADENEALARMPTVRVPEQENGDTFTRTLR